MAGRTRSSTARAWRVDAAVNEERILSAARSVFARGGAYKLIDVAEEAEIGIATLYRHFPNKEALARAVYTQIFDTEIAPLLTAPKGVPVRQTLVAVAERLLDLIDLEPGLIASSDSFAALTDDQLHRFLDCFATLLEQGQSRHEIRPDLQTGDIPQLLVMLVTGLSSPAVRGETRSRYLALLLDAIEPRAVGSPLPPLARATPLETIRTSIGAAAAQPLTRPSRSLPRSGSSAPTEEKTAFRR
ncbi:TetR/AcrR family transcriptional regulator [Rhodococcus erythropolis]|uniref:TetR/AcrR family transcriptional regulator n=1 Tax=Rhodococcus erythropolis TaxID=1833 RepID=UPI0039C03C97